MPTDHINKMDSSSFETMKELSLSTPGINRSNESYDDILITVDD